MIVAWSMVWLTVDKTLEVKIFSKLPVSPNISSSHKMLNTSPTIGSSTLKGNCTSSLDEAMKLHIHELSAQLTSLTYLGPYPDTVKIQLTHLLLCNGSSVNIWTCCVLLAIPWVLILEPVTVAAIVVTATPPAPARNPVMPVIPMDPRIVPKPILIMGTANPADRPIIRPPPKPQ